MSGKKMVLIPKIPVKTWVEVDKNLKGDELEKFFESFRQKMRDSIDDSPMKKEQVRKNVYKK